MIKRTDLALELTQATRLKSRFEHIKRSDVTVNAELSRKLNKPQGKYCTVESDAVRTCRHDLFDDVAKELADAIRDVTADAFLRADLPHKNNKDLTVLAVGLGNPHMTADALGSLAAKRLTVTRHVEGVSPRLCVLFPGVLGVTGIESFDVILGVCQRIRPDLLIAVDSLASAAVNRIAAAFQTSGAGITPGSGVSNHRARLDYASLGVPVVSVGVPLVVYASTIIADAVGEKAAYDESIGALLVTPKDIDLFVSDCAEIVAKAIDSAFFMDTLP